MKIYAMSDIHGCLDAFEQALENVDLSDDNMLILLGDYIHGGDESHEVLERIMSLQAEYGYDKVVALAGNHEIFYLEGHCGINSLLEHDHESCDTDRYYDFISGLPLYYTTDTQIFCHAGVSEEYGEDWESYTDDHTYVEKFPAETGEFCADIIAGHIYTGKVADDRTFSDIYFDGASLYYIDGDVLTNGQIPVLMYDTYTKNYYQIKNGYPMKIEEYEKFRDII